MSSHLANEKIVLFTAENFGFGPSSLAISVAQEFAMYEPIYERWFAGSGVALQLAKASRAFDLTIDWEPTKEESLPKLVKALGHRLKYSLSSVSPSGAKHALNYGGPVGYIEPLLWYFNEVPEYLSKVSNFFVQEFDDTSTHIRRLGMEGFPIFKTNWVTPKVAQRDSLIIEAECFSANGDIVELTKAADSGRFTLINFGGVDNIFSTGSAYPTIMTDLIIKALERRGIRRPLVCIGGGNAVAGLRNRFGHDRISWSGAVSPNWAKHLVRRSEDYFLSCGLSSLAEMVMLRTNGFGLPSQNYSQHLQIQAFRKIIKGWDSFDWSESSAGITLKSHLPEADGVAQICSTVSRFINDERMHIEISAVLDKYIAARVVGCGEYHLLHPDMFSKVDGAIAIAQLMQSEIRSRESTT
jgi:hypothetical protein